MRDEYQSFYLERKQYASGFCKDLSINSDWNSIKVVFNAISSEITKLYKL